MDRSVKQSMDPVRRGVHGPGVSVFGSPLQHSIIIFLNMLKVKGIGQVSIQNLLSTHSFCVFQVHLLTLVGHGIFRNNVCNDPLLQVKSVIIRLY